MLFKVLPRFIPLLMTFSLLGSFSYALTPVQNESVVNAFDAGQTVQKVMNNNRQMPGTKAGPSLKGPPPPSQPIPGGDKIKLKLKKVSFSGNTIYSDKELASLFAPYLDKTITLNNLQGLVDEVTNLYRDQGYVLSQAILPPQTIKDGEVKIQVVEGYINKVEITGNPGKAKYFINKYTQDIPQSHPLKISKLEHSLLLSNDLPGVNARAVISPSATVPGAADLTIYSARKWLDAYFAYDNYGTRYLGPQETSFGFALNELLFPGDSNAFHFATTSRHKEMKYGEYVHTQYLGSKGLNFTLGANYTQTQPGFVLIDANIVGRSTSIYSNWTYPWWRSRSDNLYLHALGNYQNVDATILGGPFYQDRFRALTLGAAYNGTDRWNGYNSLNLDLSHSFGIWGANMHFYQSRPKGRTVYTLGTLSLSRLQILSQRFSLFLSGATQYACSPLLATVQFGFGGPIYGRGYDPFEIAGDRGIEGKAELRYQLNPDLLFLKNVQFYAFYDVGEIWNLDDVNLPGQQSAASTGGGTRLTLMKNLNAEFYIAKPLTKAVAALVAMNSNGHQARTYFQLVARF